MAKVPDTRQREPSAVDDLLKEAREAFQLAEDNESDNRKEAEHDIRFGRLGEQWPSEVLEQFRREKKPILTINRLPAFMRQVINDSRQNKPSIKVHPADSNADVETAEIINGLIRNIEYSSNADVAYDTGAENAVSNGFGYWRIGLNYAHEDTFDLDITIDRVANPFSVYGDPYSTAADSSDWNTAFVVESVPKANFKRLYPGATETDFGGAEWNELNSTSWVDGDSILVAEYWTREEYTKKVLKLSDGTVISEDRLTAELAALIQAGVLQVVGQREAKCWKVKQHTLTGAEVLNSRDWPGQYIPIVPVYGDEVNLKGKRVFRSLIRDAKDPQRMHNYWRSKSTALVALAPIVPWIGPVGMFATDADKWATANTVAHPYMEFDLIPQAPGASPQRLPLDSGPAGGAIQEALMASDDMKAVMGIYDASLGAKSNETSGRAIVARQREGDTSTFHFVDNVARAIRHTGRLLIDLIPKVYTGERMVRILGEDGTPEMKQLGRPEPVLDEQTGQPMQQQNPQTGLMEAMTRINDLGLGKYDLTVTTGPSFTTRREEAAYSMTEALRVLPDAAPIIVPELAKNLDWPGADDIAKKLEQQANGGVPPEVQQQMEQAAAQIEALTQENQQLKSSQALDAAKMQTEQQKAQADAALQAQQIQLDREKLDMEREKLRIEYFKAQTDRMQAMKPEPAPVIPAAA